jgi:hypothetical protein
MSDVTDAEREALHKMLDEAIDERELIPTDGFARDRLRSAASLLFKRLVGQHVVEVHHADDSLSRKPNDRLGRLASICVWAGYTLPDGGDGNITGAEAWRFATELTDLRYTAPNAMPNWLRPQGSAQGTPEATKLRALAVSWAIAIRPFFTKKEDSDRKVASAFGVSSEQLNNWKRQEIKHQPAFASQLRAASFGHDGPGEKCAMLIDGDKNLLVTAADYEPHLQRHGEPYKKKFAGTNS